MDRQLRLKATRIERMLRRNEQTVVANVMADLLSEVKDLERKNADLETLLRREQARA